MKKYLFFGVVLLSTCKAFGQVKGMLYGKVIDAANQVAIPKTAIINKRSREVATSDEKGLFSVAIEYSDSLIISCNGFRNRYFTLFMKSERHDGVMYIYMQNDTLYLKPVDIKRPDLAKAMSTPVKDTIKLAGVKRYEGPPDEIKPSPMRPVTFLYEMFNKEAITKRNLKRARRIRRDRAYGGVKKDTGSTEQKANNLH